MHIINDEQKAKALADINYFRKEMAPFLERTVIIKEELKSNAEFGLSVFFGVFFSAATVLLFLIIPDSSSVTTSC